MARELRVGWTMKRDKMLPHKHFGIVCLIAHCFRDITCEMDRTGGPESRLELTVDGQMRIDQLRTLLLSCCVC